MDENEEQSTESSRALTPELKRASDESGKRYARQPIKAVVEFFDDSSQAGVAAVTANLSGGGLFALMETPLPLGNVVTFRIALGRSKIAGWGEVVWVREEAEVEHLPKGIGVQFLTIRGRDRLSRTLLAFSRRP